MSSFYFTLLVEFAVSPMSSKFSLLACFDRDFPQYLCTSVCEILFCYVEFIVRAQLCSVILSLRRAFIFPPKTVCNFVLLVTYIYLLCPENSIFFFKICARVYAISCC